MRQIYFLTFFLIGFHLYPQSQGEVVDSLMSVAETANDSVRLRIFNKVGFYYIFNDPPKAKTLLEKGLRESREKKVPFSEAEHLNTLGIYMDVSGKSDSAKYFFEKSLQLSRKKNFLTITPMVINNLGMFHWKKENFNEALKYFFQALEMNRNNTSEATNAAYLNNIGLIYQEMGQLEKALEYQQEGLRLRRKYKKTNHIPVSLHNIGVILTKQKKIDEAEQTYQEAIEAALMANDLGIYYASLRSLSNIYMTKGEVEKAIPLLEEAIRGREENNIDRRAGLNAISSLIRAYNSLGNYEKAFKYIEKGNALMEEFPDLKPGALDFYSETAYAHYGLGNLQKGRYFLEKAFAAKDSLFSIENAAEIARLETKYEVAKKELDLTQAQVEISEKELKLKRKNTLVFGGFGLALLLGFFGFLFYNQQKLKNRQLQKENELRTALATIETQNRLQQQRQRISRDLHDNIGSQLSFIISTLDNIKYKLKNSGEDTEKITQVKDFAAQTIYELRDTIWAMNKHTIALEDLQARIADFMDKAKSSAHNIRFSFVVDKNIKLDYPFDSETGMNVYRIIQEVITNTLKHAEASKIEVRITQEGKYFKIKISDDGKGFDQNNIQMGNGLNNIKKRAREVEGKLKILSDPEQGTEVTLTFPVEYPQPNLNE